MIKKVRINIEPTKILLVAMLLVIMIGSILLMLPMCNKKPITWTNSIFVSTSAVCVTGLTPVIPIEQFSFIGQFILLLLIQIGGIGFMTLIAIVLILIGKKLNLSDRIIIREAFNQNSFKGMAKLVKKVCTYTIMFESIGTALLATRFIPKLGMIKGIWYSIFHSISAFCNAGFDLLGRNSLIPYSSDWIVCGTIIMLIIIGGLGFTVWDDIIEGIKKRKRLKDLTVHTKLVLIITLILLIVGTILTFVFEQNNIQTIGTNTISEKILKSAFQSTTLRTAGFSTVSQNELTSVTKFLSICYMFIGGSPASTAGGIKTVTLGIIILFVINYILGKQDINIFKKEISSGSLNRAIVVFVISIFIVITSICFLLVTEDLTMEEHVVESISSYYNFSLMDIAFEVVSAFGTVGLTLGITAKLSTLGKFIIIILMIIGRLGPITISIALFKKHKETKQKQVKYPYGNILIG